jgi:hypothetical protein
MWIKKPGFYQIRSDMAADEVACGGWSRAGIFNKAIFRKQRHAGPAGSENHGAGKMGETAFTIGNDCGSTTRRR